MAAMSALGQKQTFTFRSDDARFTSKADIEVTQTDVCFVPIADIAGPLNSSHAEGQSGFAVTVAVGKVRGLSAPSAPNR
jgi:hypothetical protein